jgi:holdfast attachment protein HfaA
MARGLLLRARDRYGLKAMRRSLLQVATAAGLFGLVGASAHAGDFSDVSGYNHPYGMNAGQETAPANASLRDSNGNLTVVNGQFTSSTMSQQSGVQQMGAIGSGGGGTGALFGGATAVGNSLNVVTVGNDNTVIVNSHQTNNGNQSANVSINGH